MANDIEKIVRTEINGGYRGSGEPDLVSVGQEGVILIGLIVVLFLVSSLVVAMMSQSTSTAFSLAYENSSNRAYYLAESGFRYAVARIEHGADMQADLHLHDPAFSLAKNAGSFDLSLFPHYLETSGTISGTTLSGIDLPGGYDNGTTEALAFPGGSAKKVRIVAPDGSWDTIHDYSTATLTPTQDPATGKYTATVTFTGINPAISESLPGGTAILPVAEVDGDQNTVGSDDGSGGTVPLNVISGSIDAFPRYNGTFRMEGQGTLYAYEEKEGDTLAGISAPLDPTRTPPFSFADDGNIVSERFVRIVSIGAYRNATRTLVYHLPLATPEAAVKLEEKFDDLDNWQAPSQGTFSASGGKVDVDSVSTTASASTKAAQIQIKSGSDSPIDLARGWEFGNPNFLSYDVQVKLGFDTSSPVPADSTNTFGSPAATLPNSYMSGLNFRLSDIASSDEKKSYGLSFMRGPGASFPINGNLVPATDKHLLVLWQQTGVEASDLTWLAYKDMNPVFFSDKMESPWEDNKTSLYFGERPISWLNPNMGTESWQIDSFSGNHYWHDSPGGNYSNNLRLWLYTENMPMSHTAKAYLTFKHKYNLETNYDFGRVYIKTETINWQLLRSFTGSLSSWDTVKIDISPFLPADSVQVLFYLYSDWIFTRDGWYIDDVAINKEIPVQDSTLAVRVQEAPVVVFSGGTDMVNGIGFKDGDSIYEAGGRLYGFVDGDPIVTGGAWTANNARGLCTLRNVDYDSSKSGTSLKAVGSAVTASLVAYGERENLIRAYIGDTNGEGSVNTIATDYLKKGNAVDSFPLHWPPEKAGNWPASLDYFTLVQWDKVRKTVPDGGGGEEVNPIYREWADLVSGAADMDSGTFSLIDFDDNTDPEYNTIIRTNALVSPASGLFGQAELGLHAFGDGAENTYFDDFGVKLKIGAQYEYPPVVQQ